MSGKIERIRVAPIQDWEGKCEYIKEDGTRCRGQKIKGRDRCRWHLYIGRKKPGTPKGIKKPDIAYSIYYNGLFDQEEMDVYNNEVFVGNLDHELKMLRIQLRRAYQNQILFDLARQAGTEEDFLILEEVESFGRFRTTKGGNGPRTMGKMYKKLIHRKKDYQDDILRITKLIGTLETKRSDILKNRPPDDPNSPLNRLIEVLGGLKRGTAQTVGTEAAEEGE